MADNTPIEWTDATWNTVGGCTRVHDGCTNCYAEIMAARFSKPGQWGEGLAQIVTRPDGSKDHRWTGAVRFNAKALDQPLRWKKPRLIFVNSTADTFHDGVTDEQLDQIFAVMAMCPQHTFQVLTKRPERAARYMRGADCDGARRLNVADKAGKLMEDGDNAADYVASLPWPLPNVWIGTSISDQASADAMIPHLLATPAAVRFASAGPLLGRLDLRFLQPSEPPVEIDALAGTHGVFRPHGGKNASLDWIIVGGESGPGARPMHLDWARSLRDQCNAAGVAFFFKQWGEWVPHNHLDPAHPWHKSASGPLMLMGKQHFFDTENWSFKVGKTRAGRLLDGREWNEMPGEQP